jgi:ABC-type amino acid transport substrate-binding protein
VLISVVLCCQPAQAQVRNYDAMIAAGELKVAVYKDFAPYSFEDAGQPRGVDVELAQALAKALGVRLTLIWAPAGKNSTTTCATTSGAAARCTTSNWPT